MPRSSSNDTLLSTALALNILSIGLWEDDVQADCLRGDAVMARMYGLSEDEADQGISWTRLSSIYHPEDPAWDTACRRRVREEGGLFVWEHRIVPAPDLERWVLVRGHFERSADGHMRGRGIVIDITDTRSDGYAGGASRFLLAPEAMSSPAERMAKRALEMWEMMHELEAARAARLEPLLKAVMLELGCEIAASLLVGTSPEPPLRSGDPKLH
jgi:hypothetical protein